MKLRPILLFWHRWFGLLAAIWIALLAITGCAIVFYDELDTALNPELRLTSNEGTPVSIDEIIAAAERAAGGGYATFYDTPAQAHQTALVLVSPRAEGAHPAFVFVDPYTGVALGLREAGELGLDRLRLMDTLYQLHLDLALGEPMIWFLGLVALLWALDHIAAIALSFPAVRKWRESFGVQVSARGPKRTYDLHRASGLWLAPVTLMLAVSGVYFNWMEGFTHAVEIVSPVTPRYGDIAPEREAPLIDPPLRWSAARAVAEDAAPGAELDMLFLRPRTGLYEARLYDVRDIDSYGRRLISIDADTGVLLDDRHVAAGTAGDVFIAWQYPLHSGKAFGWPGRLIVLFAGLATIMLSWTGISIWLRKRGVKRRAAT